MLNMELSSAIPGTEKKIQKINGLNRVRKSRRGAEML
jgi:hypothetical protein